MSKRKKISEFLRIGVLMGGLSSEREISLKSGRAAYNALVEAGYMVLPLDLQEYSASYVEDMIKENKLDMLFLALHGEFGEDGSIQKILDDLDVPYTGSGHRASQLAMDKLLSRRIFEEAGLSVPIYTAVSFKDKEGIPEKAEGLKLPLVVKPINQGSSIGMHVVENYKQLSLASQDAFRYSEIILIEEFLEGSEITVGVLSDTPLEVIQILPKGGIYNYTSKYTDGETRYLVPAPLNQDLCEKAKTLALRAHKSLGCAGVSRVDMKLDKEDNIKILEVNTIPGLTSVSLLPKAAKAVGLEFNDLCTQMLELALVEYEKKKNTKL